MEEAAPKVKILSIVLLHVKNSYPAYLKILDPIYTIFLLVGDHDSLSDLNEEFTISSRRLIFQ